LVYLQEMLSVLQRNSTNVHVVLGRRLPNIVRVFATSGCEIQSNVKRALKACSLDPNRKFVKQLTMSFDSFNKLCKIYALVPYLIGEHQLFG
jgi:hypothetical protein